MDGNENLEEYAATTKQPEIVTYNKDDEMETKYAVAAPTVKSSRPSENPFSKKRPVEEITTKAAPQVEDDHIEAPAADEDVEMVEDGAEQITQKMAAAKVEESPLPQAPQHESLEDNWKKLKIQNQLMNNQASSAALESA